MRGAAGYVWVAGVRGTIFVRGAAAYVWNDSFCTEMMLNLVNTREIAYMSCKIGQKHDKNECGEAIYVFVGISIIYDMHNTRLLCKK